MYTKSKSPQQTRTYMQMGYFMMSVDYMYLTYITCVQVKAHIHGHCMCTQ